MSENRIGGALEFSECFSQLLRLKAINLSNNQIASLQFATLQFTLPALTHMNLSNNKIASITTGPQQQYVLADDSTEKVLPALMELNMENNPISQG